MIASAAMLFTLLASVCFQAFAAFSAYAVRIDFTAPQADAAETELLSDYYYAAKARLAVRIGADRTEPGVETDLNRLVSRLALLPVIEQARKTGPPLQARVRLSARAETFLDRGRREIRRMAAVRLSPSEIEAAGPELLARFMLSPAEMEPDATYFLQIGASVFRLTAGPDASLSLGWLAGPKLIETETEATLIRLNTPEVARTISDRQAAWLLSLSEQGRIVRVFNTSFFTEADSAYPERAGVAAALIGSLMILLITAAFAAPMGLAAAVYLEEFAPQTRMTRALELAVHNLAATPSIVFGLAAAVALIGFFGLPRGAPLVGGAALGVMAFPHMVLSSRAAIAAVPQSVRDAALGLGASRAQMVLHHVLPYAAPGLLTGVIVALARALGEAAPLLLVGMVGFIADLPSSIHEEATALPVLIYHWSTGAERAWRHATAAAALALLLLMFAMSAAAVLIRQHFSRRRR